MLKMSGKILTISFFFFQFFFSFLLHNFFAADFFPHNFLNFDASLLVPSTQVPGIRLGMWSGTIGWWDDWNGQWTLRDLKNVVQFEAFYWIMLVKCRVGLGRREEGAFNWSRCGWPWRFPSIGGFSAKIWWIVLFASVKIIGSLLLWRLSYWSYSQRPSGWELAQSSFKRHQRRNHLSTP